MLWEARYDGPNDSRDVPADIEVDDTGHVSVAVTSKGPGVNDDFALIRYDEAGSPGVVVTILRPCPGG